MEPRTRIATSAPAVGVLESPTRPVARSGGDITSDRMSRFRRIASPPVASFAASGIPSSRVRVDFATVSPARDCDIFTPQEEEPADTVGTIERPPKLAREAATRNAAPREDDDPVSASHRWAGSTLRAWGRFEAAERDARFSVLAGSRWRAPILDRVMPRSRRSSALPQRSNR
jgi:hypothetical protein